MGDEKYKTHAELLFPAAAVNAKIGSAFFDFLSEPKPLLGIQSREQIDNFIANLAGEAAETVLARFKAPSQLARAKALERVIVLS
ncbi:hypothetical protein [Bradyrhizobium sp. JR3.5]